MHLPIGLSSMAAAARIDSRVFLSIFNRCWGQRSNYFYSGQAQRSSSTVVCLRNVQYSVKLIRRQLISTTLNDMNNKKDSVKKEDDKSATKTDDSTMEEEEKPIKFSTSPAYKGKASKSRSSRLDLSPNLRDVRIYEPWFNHFRDTVVVLSIVAFLAWFGIFREENDIDEELGKPLYKRVPAMEQQVLEDMIAVARYKGEDENVSKYEKRLEEVKKDLHKQMTKKK